MSSEIETVLKKTGALMEGHYLLSSGLHSPIYWEKFRILEKPADTEILCKLIASHFKNNKVDLVAGPTVGGIIIAYEVARQLGVRGIYAERGREGRVFRRGFTITKGDNVLVVDDVLTTGSSIQEMLSVVNNTGGNVVGVGVLVNRASAPPDFGVPFFSCFKLAAPTFRPEDCPLCKAGTALVKPGSSEVSV